MVFVLNKDKTPLAPCHETVARKLLKQGKAVVHKIYPFTENNPEITSHLWDRDEWLVFLFS